MTARTRTFNSEISISGRLYYITWRYKTINIGESGSCEDHIGNYPSANSLSILKQVKNTPFLNGQYWYNGNIIRDFQNYPPGCYGLAIPDPYSKFPEANLATLNNAAWDILAKSNPSLPHVNVPAAIGELKDLPSLVRGWGRKMISNVAKGYITWRWAIKPMISDISKLFQFQKAVDERLAELRRLRDGKEMRKRVSLGSDRIVTTPTRISLHSEGASVYGWRTDYYTQKRWGSANWKVQSNSVLKSMSDDPREGSDLYRFTRRTLMGVNSYGALAAAWELCPWSWLVDWFSNVGTMISATNNAVGCTWSRLCYMATSTCRVEIIPEPVSTGWLTFTGEFDWKKTRKDRRPCYPISPIPLPYLPILTAGKLSILAALAALRR
jgi:hypothetical protein